MPKITVLLSGSGGPAGLGAIKSLKEIKERKIGIIGVDADPFAPGSFLVDKFYTVPKAFEQNFVDKLFRICKREKIDVIIPTVDDEIFVLSNIKQKFESEDIRLLIPDHKTFLKAYDKGLTVKTAEENGIDVPKTFFPNNSIELKKISKQLGSPFVVRPRISHGGRGIFYVETIAEATAAFNWLKREGSIPMVQQYVKRGSVYSVATLFDRRSELVAVGTMKKLREKPPSGGVAWAGETVKNPKIQKLGIKIIKSFENWVGPATAEIKFDGKNAYLMEVNPRLWGYNYLMTKAGINFPYLTVKLALNEKVKVGNYRTGLKFVRVWEDVVY
ncbi:MAG: ATP-grasp domain-containing protein [Euryarchaeota archaeon]|nr:ATP-grasp domain-containing protein [Euryarchaeota archaeon]